MERPIELTAETLWNEVAGRLKGALNETTYRTWFAEAEGEDLSDDEVKASFEAQHESAAISYVRLNAFIARAGVAVLHFGVEFRVRARPLPLLFFFSCLWSIVPREAVAIRWSCGVTPPS